MTYLVSPPIRRISKKLGNFNFGGGTYTKKKAWRGVFFSGPQPERDIDGNSILIWIVFIGNKARNPLGRVYKCLSYHVGQSLALQMAKDRKLDLINDATSD